MKKRLCSLVMILVMVFTLCQFHTTKTYAATIEEAEDYVLQETYELSLAWSAQYYKVTIPEKSHVSLSVSSNGRPDCTLYTTDGKIVLASNEVIYQQDFETGIWSALPYRVLSAGTYYLKISCGQDIMDVSFCMQAEKQITLPKGSISSVKSSKKGQMTVKCASSDDAVGYRIQYSTSDKFKSVKTVYSPTATATVTGLKAGQRYYVKACPYAVYDDGTRVYGQNSYIKTVKIKK